MNLQNTPLHFEGSTAATHGLGCIQRPEFKPPLIHYFIPTAMPFSLWSTNFSQSNSCQHCVIHCTELAAPFALARKCAPAIRWLRAFQRLPMTGTPCSMGRTLPSSAHHSAMHSDGGNTQLQEELCMNGWPSARTYQMTGCPQCSGRKCGPSHPPCLISRDDLALHHSAASWPEHCYAQAVAAHAAFARLARAVPQAATCQAGHICTLPL